MPHIPKNAMPRFAPTGGPPPELGVAAPPRPIPVRAPARRERDNGIALAKISPNKHEVSVDHVCEQLFGKKLKVDPQTGLCNLSPLFKDKEVGHGAANGLVPTAPGGINTTG